MLIISASCTRVNKPFTYKIMYLESDTVAYSNKLMSYDDFPEDAMVYKYINGKYIQVMQVYE